jgi:dodecin
VARTYAEHRGWARPPARPGRLPGERTGRRAMAAVKVIAPLGGSERGWEDASREVVEEATQTLRGVRSVWIEELQATVENDRVKNYRVTATASFVMERS